MQRFENVAWKTQLVEESYAGQTLTSAHYTISDWKIPFTFEEWCQSQHLSYTTGPEDIYTFCSQQLTRPFCKQMVLEAGTRLDLDPGFVTPYEKMASFYILRLLAGIPRKEVWKIWTQIPVTNDLLKDEVFCLCIVALHPILYGKLHPIGRNNRRVILEAISRWDLPNYSILQFVHPNAMVSFKGRDITPHSIGFALQPHKDLDQQYWVFNDYSVVTRVIGKPGERRWFELQFAGPQVIQNILKERQKHGASIKPVQQFIQNNNYWKK